jgi:hypothetical protein
MEGPKYHRCQPNPRFADDDDVITFSEVQSQWRKEQSPGRATCLLIDIIYLRIL